MQLDIMNLMFKGYHPEDFPETKSFEEIRTGERLTRKQVAKHLNVSEGCVNKQTNEFFKRLEVAGILDKILLMLSETDAGEV